MRLTVITAEFGAALHVPGAGVELKSRTFELPPEIAAYIERQMGQTSTVTLAIEKDDTP